MAEDSTEIALQGVSVHEGDRQILRDVSVRLDQRRIAVIGANGSGKSTFARLLNGLVAPSGGSVRVHGIDVVRDARKARARVGFVFTDPDAQILMPTVAEDVSLSLRSLGVPKAERAGRVRDVLERYGLAGHAEHPAHSLSGGEKQLLALASVLVRAPRLVVADEPTTLLDLGNSRLISRLLLDELDAQLVVVTHDLALAARCDVALRFADGRLVEIGPAADVVARYQSEYDRADRPLGGPSEP